MSTNFGTRTEELQYLGQVLTATAIEDIERVTAVITSLNRLIGSSNKAQPIVESLDDQSVKANLANTKANTEKTLAEAAQIIAMTKYCYSKETHQLPMVEKSPVAKLADEGVNG